MVPPSAKLVALGLALVDVCAASLASSSHRSLRLETRLSAPGTSSQGVSVDPVAKEHVSKPRTKGTEKASQEILGDFDPFASEHFYGNLKCGVTVQVGSHDHKFEMCPEECPYYAQDLDDDLHCSFVCVKGSDCATRNPNRPIADVIDGHKTCRGPRVADCQEYHLDGTDSCKVCQLFYTVGSDGMCHFNYPILLWTVIALFVALTLFLLVWVVDCCVRPAVNTRGVKKGKRYRSLQKIHDPEGKLYSIYTNTCMEDVAGPGMLLHFRMQVFLIVWACIIAFIWLCFATFVDNDLFILGKRRFGTPRENCILVAWGYETQQRLMWAKVTFLMIAYIVTFVLTLGHAILQQAEFERLNSLESSMEHIMAMMGGLPTIQGSDANIEDEICKFLSDNGVEGVVGVSIAWNFAGHEDEVQLFLEKAMMERAEKYERAKFSKTHDESDNWQVAEKSDYSDEISNPVHKQFYKLEKRLFDADDENPEDWSSETQTKFIKGLESSHFAFVVFKNQALRDAALGVTLPEFRSSSVSLEQKICEPDTVNWQNFDINSLAERAWRLFQGFGAILLALLFWTVVFYSPYAYQVFFFNYENGAQPPAFVAFAFGMVVVAGNAIMCEVCGRVSDHVRFKTRDDRESCYLILYVIACMFNVLLDMVCTYYLAEYVLDGLGFRTYFGVRFQDVPTFTERFETYAMQRMLAESTYAYAFPSSFLIPFLIEPFVTITIPYMLGKLMVQTHKEWVGRDAELWMVAFEFDMGRYGDLLLNMLLALLIFFFPGGYTLTLFFGMAASHAYVYLFDHTRVLRTIPKCTYASMNVDWWCNWMMAPITAMIPMCLVFKANCQDYGYCINGMTLIEAIWATWVLHTIIHTLLLLFVVPKFKPDYSDQEAKDTSYETIAKQYPCNWFTSNPIHCLRSQHLHGLSETEHCTYYMLGKAHTLNFNPKIGLHFQGSDAGGDEEYVESVSDVWRSLSQKSSGK